MNENQFINCKFGFLGQDFLRELEEKVEIRDVKSKTEIISEGQNIKSIPFLISGSIKVFSLNDGRELIYYYIRPMDSCMMTFSTLFTNSKSRIYAITEENSQIMFIPVSTIQSWLLRFPTINKIFFQEYDRRFTDIMNMVNDAVFHKLDTRVLNYIKNQIVITGCSPIKITHREIASNLGTSREVVSRVLKKMENDGEINQNKEGFMLPFK